MEIRPGNMVERSTMVAWRGDDVRASQWSSCACSCAAILQADSGNLGASIENSDEARAALSVQLGQ